MTKSWGDVIRRDQVLVRVTFLYQVCKERKNRGFKWELHCVSHHGKNQTNQGEVLDDCCHVTSAFETLRTKGHVITRFFSNNLSFSIFSSTIISFPLQSPVIGLEGLSPTR